MKNKVLKNGLYLIIAPKVRKRKAVLLSKILPADCAKNGLIYSNRTNPVLKQLFCTVHELKSFNKSLEMVPKIL